MKFKDLTEKDIKFAKEIYTNKEMSWDSRMLTLMNYFGKSERTIRKWCSNKFNFKEKVDIDSEQYELAKQHEYDKSKSRFIVTWAQNNTPIHKQLMENIEKYAEHINANIHVIAGRYKNPTSLDSSKHIKEMETWSNIKPEYLDAKRHDIHKYVSIMSDVKIQPTAVNPMSGLQGISGVNSCIFGSPKVQLECIPVLKGNKPKMMITTGALTKLNYTDSKAGKKGEFHHTYGFVIVEIKDEETFYVRQVTADDKTGEFNDLCYNVKDGIVSQNKTISAIILGDLHYGSHDERLLDKTLYLMKTMPPKHVILHDVFDGYSINHHEIKDPFIQYAKEVKNQNSIKIEINNLMSGLKKFENFENVVIVRSNHDDFLDRWLKNEDWKKQPTTKNSLEYMEYSAKLLKQYADDPDNVIGIIPELIKEQFPKYITLGKDDSYRVNNWEVGQHGDAGSNGSRGNLIQFRNLNTKIIVGHYHTPSRKDGAISVGTSTKLRLGYNRGASSWMQSHVIIHNDGRAQHITFIRDKNNILDYTTLNND